MSTKIWRQVEETFRLAKSHVRVSRQNMVRTKADCSGAKTSGAKAPRKVVSHPKAMAASSSSLNSGGGNPYNPQPTPEWQKEITKFFPANTAKENNTESEGNNSEIIGKNDEKLKI